MGCFSYLCAVSGEQIQSTSFDGDPVHIFLLVDGRAVEYMHGNYDSYGRVFDGNGSSFEWEMNWGKAVDLHFDGNIRNGFAMIKDEWFNKVYPSTISYDDPEQGWGNREKFKQVDKPFHIVLQPTLIKRTFEARDYPDGTYERAKFNESPVTSEYMPSQKWLIREAFLMSDGTPHPQKYTYRAFSTKRSAEAYLKGIL